MRIKTLQSFAMQTSSGELIIYAYGEVVTIDDTTGNQLIDAGLAEIYTDPGGGGAGTSDQLGVIPDESISGSATNQKAINIENKGAILKNASNIGTLTELNTTDKKNLVRAVNEVKKTADDAKQNLADYRGSYATYADLLAYVGEKAKNDYAYVRDDETHDHECTRYIYVAGTTNAWVYQITINESPLTQAQIDALNSGIDATKVEQIAKNKTDIEKKQDKLNTTQMDAVNSGITSEKIEELESSVGAKAGTGLVKDGDTINHSNSVSANTTKGLKFFTYDEQGHVTAATNKTLGRGLSDSGDEIGHSKEIKAATTNDRMYPLKFDEYGHITEYGTGHAYSSEYKSAANNQLFLRNGANAMWKQVTHLVGFFSRNASQTFTMNAWSNISLTASSDTDEIYAKLSSNGVKLLKNAVYRFDITVRLTDSISSSTFIEWAVGITGHDDDSLGGAWLATLHRHKATVTIFAYVTANSVVYPRIYSTGGINTINYCNCVVSCIKEA